MESGFSINRQSFKGKKILVVGDLVADQFLSGTISRVSREAPVFILKHDETETRPGAAANAAANIASLGAEPIVIGVVGDDANGKTLVDGLGKLGATCDFVQVDLARRTTTKVRVLAGHHYAARQQVIRIDYESSAELLLPIRKRLIDSIRASAAYSDGIVISDYGYGVADAHVYAAARQAAAERSLPLIVDSRSRLESFQNATSATPNQEEIEQILGKAFTDQQCDELRGQLGFEALLVTCGNQGMRLYRRNEKPERLEAHGSKEPVDVTGAGDTVIAVYSLALATGLNHSEAAKIANHAGGLVVMKKGTATVSIDELLLSLDLSDKTNTSETATQ